MHSDQFKPKSHLKLMKKKQIYRRWTVSSNHVIRSLYLTSYKQIPSALRPFIIWYLQYGHDHGGSKGNDRFSIFALQSLRHSAPATDPDAVPIWYVTTAARSVSGGGQRRWDAMTGQTLIKVGQRNAYLLSPKSIRMTQWIPVNDAHMRSVRGFRLGRKYTTPWYTFSVFFSKPCSEWQYYIF